MSANLIVDIGGSCVFNNSIEVSALSGVLGALSGATQPYGVGASVDMINANTNCQICITGVPIWNSGLIVGVQTSDTDVSGLYTDPTAGLQTFPTWFSSGGLLWLNSGGTGGIQNSGALSGFAFQSGFCAFAAFQRPQRYVRATFPSSATTGQAYGGSLTVSFISQYKQTGSGGGYTPAPSSGTVNV